MTWAQNTLAFIETLPYLDEWPDARVILSGHRYIGTSGEAMLTLPLLTCSAVGGDPERAIPLAAGFTLLNLASEVLDDFQDQDPNSAWATWPLNRVVTATLALIFLSQSCFARLNTDRETLGEIIDNYAQVGVLATVGQSRPVQSLDDYWAHTNAKSGLIFAVGSWSGVRLATQDESKLTAAREFGLALGILSQADDDCRDFYTAVTTHHPTEYLASLPVILALENQDHPLHQELAHLLGESNSQLDSTWGGRVRDLAIQMGGLSSGLGVAKVYEQKALAALASLGPSEELTNYVRLHLRYVDV